MILSLYACCTFYICVRQVLSLMLISNLMLIKLEAQWAEPVSLNFHFALRKLNTEPSMEATHHVSVHLAKQLQRRRFLEIDQSEIRMACGGHVY